LTHIIPTQSFQKARTLLLIKLSYFATKDKGDTAVEEYIVKPYAPNNAQDEMGEIIPE